VSVLFLKGLQQEKRKDREQGHIITSPVYERGCVYVWWPGPED
jgi:hypothetical protein